MLCYVILHRAHLPAIHAASHVEHEKKSCMIFYFYAHMWLFSFSGGLNDL